MAALVGIKWLAVDGVDPILSTWDHPGGVLPPLMNLVALDGVILCAIVGGLMAQLRRIRPDSDSELHALAIWLALIVFAILNLEACRAVDWIAVHQQSIPDPGIIKQVAMSVLWATVGFATILVGFRRGIAPLRYAALALLGITLLKILIVDMAEVKAVWRILSFVAVGSLLLCVSYIYHSRLSAERAN